MSVGSGDRCVHTYLMSTTPDGGAFSLLDDLTSFGVDRFDQPNAFLRVALGTRWRGASTGSGTAGTAGGLSRNSKWKGESGLTAARAGAGVLGFFGLGLSSVTGGGWAMFVESSWRMLVLVMLPGWTFFGETVIVYVRP